MQQTETVASLIDPIVGRHIPYRLENGDLIIQNDIILLIDQLGKYKLLLSMITLNVRLCFSV